MDLSDLRRSSSNIDLESGGNMMEEDEGKSLISSGENSKKLLKRVWSGFLGLKSPDKIGRVKTSLSLYDKLMNSDEIRRTDKVYEKMIGFKEKKLGKKKLNVVRPAKPPRPPKGPTLNAADVKLVKEITELTMLKRKRIERLKALRKLKKGKPSIMNSNLLAMVITILFFVVIIMQGLLGSRI